MKIRYIALLLLVLFLLLPISCNTTNNNEKEVNKQAYTEYPLIVRFVSDMPNTFDLLIIQDNLKFVSQHKVSSLFFGGAIWLIHNSYYEQIWTQGQEDATWVLRDDTDTILSGDNVRLTYLNR